MKKKIVSRETRLKMSMKHFHRQGGEYRKKTQRGYITVFSPYHPNKNSGGRVFEHRLVMESKLGRLLLRNEIVHHLNGIKDDNRPENLYVVSSHKEHRERELRELTCPHCKESINGIRLN